MHQVYHRMFSTFSPQRFCLSFQNHSQKQKASRSAKAELDNSSSTPPNPQTPADWKPRNLLQFAAFEVWDYRVGPVDKEQGGRAGITVLAS
ncbi:Hypothetical predicted protein [Prunus dulcis]|uniref:Uncharacterized protein n=1 Tax=Prunus dulcis TaxID=3755 RepID=A0A5E4FET8_PRUDU|nr:Hypothetical predicted protein [Prunus dulcis]